MLTLLGLAGEIRLGGRKFSFSFTVGVASHRIALLTDYKTLCLDGFPGCEYFLDIYIWILIDMLCTEANRLVP